MKNIMRVFLLILFLDGCHPHNGTEQLWAQKYVIRKDNKKLNLSKIKLMKEEQLRESNLQSNSMNFDSVENNYSLIRYTFPMTGLINLDIPRNGTLSASVRSNCILILSGKPEDNNRKLYKVICYKPFPKNVVTTPLGCTYFSKYQSEPPKGYVIARHEMECRPEYIESAVKELEAKPDLEDIAVDYSTASKNKRKVYLFIKYTNN
ncbi:hypothetical protein [Snodgrassella communis]|uniref:hypothetical protein n=1 Tax=Snodgrassella communis TaxID=2946699 RepID=UPI001EF5B5CE|nr:hypothetical protein [Snodgrassella communis]